MTAPASAAPEIGTAPGAIVLSQLTRVFERAAVPALNAISAVIPGGRITGLVGPDGAGKTTLMRIMAGLLVPTSGSLRVAGLDPVSAGHELRAHVGYMPQKFGLYEDLTVLENLNLYADLRAVIGAERERSFEELLAFTDLARFTRRPAGKLSGGMKQKLGLACVLLGQPGILLLDEPSVGVDPISRRELWRMVTALTVRGLTVVWSTSYLDEAEACAHVMLLNLGDLKYEGAPADLTERLRGRVIQLRGVVHDRREVLARALRTPQVSDGVIQGAALRLVLREADHGPALPDIGAEGATVAEVAPRLEDAFVDLLGGGPGGHSGLAEKMQPVVMEPRLAASVIRAVGLTKQFGEFTATDNVSFTVPQGEIFGLLGPNGAGKSTTFKMLCGLLRPTRGTAEVMGIDLAREASRARQRIGYMAQKFSLYGTLSVLQNLRFFSGVYGLRGGIRASRIDSMIETFGLTPYLNSTTEKLPLGFKQRLALACAMMHEPDVLFLDEPTSGVDPITRREFWTHINGVVHKGVTVMVTTHFMDEAEYCDRIGLVYRGQMIAVGPPDELKAKAATAEAPDPTMEDAFIRLVEQAPVQAAA